MRVKSCPLFIVDFWTLSYDLCQITYPCWFCLSQTKISVARRHTLNHFKFIHSTFYNKSTFVPWNFSRNLKNKQKQLKCGYNLNESGHAILVKCLFLSTKHWQPAIFYCARTFFLHKLSMLFFTALNLIKQRTAFKRN